MKKLILFFAALCAWALPIRAQAPPISNVPAIPSYYSGAIQYPGAPSGGCQSWYLAENAATGHFFDCLSGSWNDVTASSTGINVTNGINAPQTLKSPLLTPVFNSVLYADGFAYFGGTYRGNWDNTATYLPFDTVTFSGKDWITPSGMAPSSTPTTSYAVGTPWLWIQFDTSGAGLAATTADKAFYWAFYQIQLTTTSFSINNGIDIEFGDATGGYDKNGDWIMPVNTEGYTISMHGKGRAATYINQATSTLNYMVTQGAAASALGQEIKGITFNANQLAGGCLSAHIRRSIYDDLVCFNPQQQGGGAIQQAMYFGQSGDGYEVSVKHILVRTPSYSTTAPAYGTCPVSGGAITLTSCTITNAGANLNIPPNLFVYFNGTNGGSSHQPCTTMPSQPTPTLSAGALTGFTAGASSGAGCGGTVYFQLYEAGTIPFLYFFGYSDSTIDDVVSTGDATTACAKDVNGFNHFTHEHQYCRAPFQVQELGRNWHTALQTDSPVQYALDLTGGGSVFLDTGYEQAAGAAALGASDVLVESTATSTHFGPSNCGTLQTASGYNKLTIKNAGPATSTSHGFPASFFITGPQLNCDGSATQWGNYPNAPADSTSVSVIDDFINGGTTAGLIGTQGWTPSTLGGSATVSFSIGTATHPGILSLATTTTSGQGFYFELGSGSAALPPLTPTSVANWSQQWITTLTGITNVSWRMGLADSHAGTTPYLNQGLYFRFDTAASDTKIMACSNVSAVETCVTTNVTPVANTYHDYYIWSDAVGIVNFQIDTGTIVTACLAATATCNITTFPAVAMVPELTMVTNTTAAQTALVDYYKYVQQGLVR